MDLQIFTIGHSTRPMEEFRSMLQDFGVGRLVDIRQYPGSRRVPQFNRPSLEASLGEAGIAYEWLVSLGGRRRPGAVPSPNMALRSESFRNYADYMLTPEFRAGIEQLIEWARERTTAIMCAEAVYWRCHRRLVSDYLTAQAIEVLHIMGPGQVRPHVLTEGAVVREGNVTYPGGQEASMPKQGRLFE